MEKLIIKKAGQSYSSSESSSDAIGYLGGFLCYDVGKDTKSWKEWVINPKNFNISSNYSHLERDADKIFITFEYNWFHEIPNSPIFETNTEELIYILDRWQEACEKKPNRIIITRDDGKVTVDFED